MINMANISEGNMSIQHASPQLRCFEVEQAAHALRHRLALASNHIRSPTLSFDTSSFTIQNDVPKSSTLASSQVETKCNYRAHTIDMKGLGIGFHSDSREELEDVTMVNALVEKEDAQIDHSTKNSIPTSQPSIYDAIFGPTFGRIAMPGVDKAKSSISPTLTPQQRSPHVRQGTSAMLSQVTSSPSHEFSSSSFVSDLQHASRHSFSAESLGGQAYTPQMNPFASPSLQWNTHNSGTLQYSEHDNRNNEKNTFYSPKQSRSSRFTSSNQKHRRMRSSGGSILPNGHPATPLAQTLFSARNARSRNASAAETLRTSKQVEGGEKTDQDAPHDPEVLAGFLLDSLSYSASHEQIKTNPNRRSSTFVDPNTVTPRRRQRNSSVDVHTPRTDQTAIQRRSSLAHLPNTSPVEEGNETDNDEAAAHSLLDLATSPSPSKNQLFSRFLGHTPSLDDGLLLTRRKVENSPRKTLMEDIDRHEERARITHSRGTPRSISHLAGRGHSRTGSLGSHGITDSGSFIRRPLGAGMQSSGLSEAFHPITPPSYVYDLSQSPRKHGRGPSQGGRIRLMSPPITPPKSEESTIASKTEQAARSDAVAGQLKRSTSPLSPLHSHGKEKLVNLQDDDVTMQSPKSEEVKTEIQASKIGFHSPTNLTRTLPIETPKTPPRLPGTPSTPKAPGSNFSYGDFLRGDLSPSPNPKKLIERSLHILNTQSNSSLPSAAFALGHRTDQTPTRASRARFPKFDNESHEAKEILEILTMEPAKKSILTEHGQHSIAQSGLGLEGAFEPMESNVLVPGKRIATTPKTKTSNIPEKRVRGPSAQA